ncbi:MAG: hypothetical protein A2289_03780 [Deltaproteobacteria bacterium RIFOXYA12_FULL_58_15]|nr:MAG: hypothetical protein A2289_03780 [Deltaproteobacteria bacterium RIFOXYA12_FULL_58_15]
MKEVSCRAVDFLAQAFENEGRSSQELIGGIPDSLVRLRNKHERIDWETYRKIMSNAARIWTTNDFEAHGHQLVSSPIYRPLAVVGRLLFTAKEIYHWIHQRGAKGAGNQLFTCILPEIQDLGANKLRVTLRLDGGHSMVPEFFHVTKGTLAAVPRVLALPSAKVEMRLLESGAIYDITYPSGGGALAWTWKTFSWPFAARRAARELKDANEALVRRYNELDEARITLDRQATQLKTAHSISQVIHGGLNLERTLEAIVGALVRVGGFASARIDLQRNMEGQELLRVAEHGDVPQGTHAILLPLTLRGVEIGRLSLWPQVGADMAEVHSFLEVVVPTVYMAIDNALTFHAVVDYRNNLEGMVERRTTELQEALDQLREAQEVRDKIFANINHEIRTPLSLITLAAKEVERRVGTNLDGPTQRRLDDINHCVRSMLDLVDGLLLLAAGQENKLRLRPLRCDLAHVINASVSTWTPAAALHGIELSYVGLDSCVGFVDRGAFDRMLANLVANAIKFTPSAGRIVIGLEQTATDQVQVTVSDTGIGIADGAKRRVFERFEQGDVPPLHGGSRGSGIGLSLVESLAKAHGGSVDLVDTPGGGSTFIVTLGVGEPVDLTAVDEQTAVELTQSLSPGERAFDPGAPTITIPHGDPTAAATVLVAEDDPGLLQSVTTLIGEKYRVLAASDGESALEMAAKYRPDVLVTDIGMPRMDGIELTRRFRALDGNRLAPVIILTAYGRLSQRLTGFEAGAVDFVVKPFQPEELMARIRSQLQIRDLALRLHEKEKISALGMLSSGLAHEMRNPANIVLNAIEPLERYLPREILTPEHPAARLLAVIKVNALHISELSRELLGLAPTAELQTESRAFPALLCQAVNTVSGAFERVRLRQTIEYEGMIRCSRPLMIQVLVNLLENAAHSAGPDGEVRLWAFAADGRLVIEIADNGPGVPVELREKIFEPFFTTKVPGKGTGLGLPLARMYVERHKGTLKIGNSAQGCMFRVELPVDGETTSEPLPANELLRNHA